MLQRYRPAVALVVFIAWVLITAFFDQLVAPAEGPQSLSETVSGTLQPGLGAAVVLLLAAVAIFRWRDIGLNPPRPTRSLRLLWFPALYVLAFVGLIAVGGLPSTKTVLIILVNTVLAGVSEELACRGVLYQGLRIRFGVWPAILGSTLLFGAVHVLNGFSTGDFLASSVQAIAAFMTGIAFVAIRVRTGSLYPGMILHAAWDFALLAAVTGLLQKLGESQAQPSLSSIGLAYAVVPLALVLPNFLYGVFLLRHATRDEARLSAAAAG